MTGLRLVFRLRGRFGFASRPVLKVGGAVAAIVLTGTYARSSSFASSAEVPRQQFPSGPVQMSKAQRVGNVYFAQFGLQAGRGARAEGFDDSMTEIRTAVDAIADVSRLIGEDNRKLARLCNDSSHRIAEVLSIIEGVALDSNLVALNAALEASREDRSRYDIALVAAEVRALLARSESATFELHALLSDTVQKVEAGALLVEEVGLTLARSAGAVRQVTEILSEIGASGRTSANDPLQADAAAE